MNETTPPPGDAQSNPASGFDRFLTWLRGLGMVRGNDRWFAGVAGGIAARAGIDPVIVRGVFVVLALLGGSGVLLYLIGWFLLPDFAGRIHLEELVRGRASAGVIVATVLLGVFVVAPLFVSVLSGLIAGPWSSGSWGFVNSPDWLRTTFSVLWFFVLLPALIVGSIIWLSRARGRGGAPHGGQPPHGRPHSGAGPHNASHFGTPLHDPTGADNPSAAPSQAATSQFAASAGTSAGEASISDAADAQTQATPWSDQFGNWSRNVREEARQWNELGHQHHQFHKIGAAHVVLTLAIALIAAGIAAAWALSLPVNGDLVMTAGLLAALSIFAISLIVAGIRGRHTGWIGFLTFVGVVALIFAPFTHLLPEHTRFVPFGSAVERVASSDEPSRAIVMLAGSIRLDLSDLAVESEGREIEIWQLFGSNTVELPADHAVRVQVDMLGGTIRGDSSGSQQSGVFLTRTLGSHPGASDDDELVEVRVRVLFGSVRIEGSAQPLVGSSHDADKTPSSPATVSPSPDQTPSTPELILEDAR